MKQYRIDELRPRDYEKLKTYLEDTYGPAELGAIHWIPIPSDCLTETQAAHSDCQPFYFALELQPSELACELLVRTRQRIRCDCIAYASLEQRNWIIDLVDAIFDELGLKC